MRPTTFEEFGARIFSPRLPILSEDDIKSTDGLQRTFSVPSRGNIMKDTSEALTKLLDLPDKTFRERSSTSVNQHTHGKHSWDGGKFCKSIF